VRQLLAAARNKYTWLLGGSIMLMYCFYTTLGYFSPLLQHNFGVTAGLIGVLGVVRQLPIRPKVGGHGLQPACLQEAYPPWLQSDW
jgi:hypothetical protein